MIDSHLDYTEIFTFLGPSLVHLGSLRENICGEHDGKEQMRGQTTGSLGNNDTNDLLSMTSDDVGCDGDRKEFLEDRARKRKPLSCYGWQRGHCGMLQSTRNLFLEARLI